MRQLQDYCAAFIVPQRDKPKEFGGNTPWCRIEDIQGKYLNGTRSGQYVSEETIKKMNLKVIPEGAVICSCSASLGVQAIVVTPCITNQTFIGIVPKEELNKEFLYYLLKSKSAYFKKIGTGTTIPYISRKKFEQLPVPGLTLTEQTKVVRILNHAEMIIEHRKKELLRLDELVKARFVELFEDGTSPLRTVEELCSEIVDCPHTTPKYEGVLKHPAIRTSEIKKGYITWDTMKYVSDDEYKERIARLRPEQGDIVYGREGIFGNAAILPVGYQFCLGQRVMLLRPDYSKCTSEYLLYAVISDDVYRQAVGKNNASTVAHVNVKDVKRFKIPLPSFEKQNEFALFVKQVDKTKKVVQNSLNKHQLLFDSLMQCYFG